MIRKLKGIEELGYCKLPDLPAEALAQAGGEPPLLTVTALINASSKHGCGLEKDVAIAEAQREADIKFYTEGKHD